jgi:NADH-quinone oxidoreductase subunit H
MHDFNLLLALLTIACVLGVLLGSTAFLIYVERKVAAYIQDRIGPNRVGPWGLFQSVADGLKFLFKEEIIPRHVDKLLYIAAPAVALMTALMAFAVVPFGDTSPPPEPPARLALSTNPAERAQYQQALQKYEQEQAAYRERYQFVIAPGLDIGILYVFAVGSLAVYGIILGGWAGNNKYSFLGALRSSAQLVSYEIPLGLSILGVVLMTGSLNPERIIHQQAQPGGPGSWAVWNVLYQPLAFLLFMVSTFAECNRLPFDLPEAEQELIGGYHTEYSAMKFAMFFLGEYTHMITTSFLMVILFFGGWHIPFLVGPDAGWFLKLIAFAGKMAFFIFFFMLVRWTIPRFRFDQLMTLAWKVFIPLALVNLVCVMFVRHYGLSPWLLLPASLVMIVGAGLMGASETQPAARVPPRVPVGGAAKVEALSGGPPAPAR